MNWDDPVARLRLAETVGPDEYNRRMEKHIEDSIVEVCNGYALRPVTSSRFGRVILVDGVGVGYIKIEAARNHANRLEPGPRKLSK